MNIRFKYILLAAGLLFSCDTFAQKKVDIWNPPVKKGLTNLEVGAVVPDFKFRLYNDGKKEAFLSDYKDQLVIFDFGNTACKGCIEALPHMDAMEKAFGDKIKIFWVTPESEQNIARFWNRKGNSYTANNGLATILEDSVARGYFKHRSWPHEAWVYKGKLVALTGPQYVDKANIEKVLSGAAVNFPVKNDFYVFDGTKEPLFKPDTNQVNPASILKYAVISDYREGVNGDGFSGGGGIVRDTVHKTIRAFFLNQPIYNSYFLNMLSGKLISPDLVKPAGQFEVAPNEIVWQVADRNKYTYSSKKVSGYEQDWVRKNGICFESLNPNTGQTDGQVYGSMNNDLNRLLGLNVRWEKRKEKVLVLVRTTADNRLPDVKSIADSKKVSTGNLVGRLNSVESNPYVFNEARFDKTAYLNLNISNWKDIAAVRKAIQPYGLDLKEEEREVDKLIFAEVDGGLLVDGEMAAAAKVKRAAQKDMKNPEPVENKSFLEANKSKQGVVVLPSGLQYKILKKGTGAKPELSDKVSVHYTGTLVNGKIFDSSYEQGKPFITRITDVIKGWQEVLQLMPVGAKWIMYVPADLAYGAHTNQGSIPPNSTLIFEIELLNIIK